jgi:hypothetical protein
MGKMADYYLEQEIMFGEDMGLGREYLAEPEPELDYCQETGFPALTPYRAALARGEKVWRTQDGRIIEIAKMTNSHLINTYNFLQRKNCITPRTVRLYLTGPQPNGDGAQMAFEEESNAVFAKRPSIQMEWIEDEIKARQLDPANPGLLHKLRNRIYPLRKAIGL